jgi:hypothetical protein
VWDRLHQAVLDELSDAAVIDWSRGCIDAVAVRAGFPTIGPGRFATQAWRSATPMMLA